MKIKNVKIRDGYICHHGTINAMSILYIPNSPTIIDVDIPCDWGCKIKTIFISDTIQFIGFGTFSENFYYNVQNLILGKNVKAIGRSAFKYSHIRKIVFPESIKTILSDAFSCCEYLRSIDFSKAINFKPTESDIFNGCSRLKEMKLTDKLKSKIKPTRLIDKIKNKIRPNLLTYRVFNVGHLKENYPEIFGDKK